MFSKLKLVTDPYLSSVPMALHHNYTGGQGTFMKLSGKFSERCQQLVYTAPCLAFPKIACLLIPAAS